MSKDKNPPLLSASKSYDDWVKLIDIWKDFTSLDKPKQALAIVLSLEDKAQEAALEISRAELASEDGVDLVIKRLDKIYKKDELSQKFNSLEAFESYRRPENTSIRDFVTEFEKRHYKVKSYHIDISDDLLGFRLMKASNLSARDEQLVKATVSDLKYEEVKTKLTKIFSEEKFPTTSNTQIKCEPTFCTQEETYDQPEQDFIDYYSEDPYLDADEPVNDAYFTNYRNSQFTNRGRGNRTRPQQNPGPSSNYNWRRNEPAQRRSTFNRNGRNPLDRSGMPTRCAVCQSINHWANQCPDRSKTEHSTLLSEGEIVLHLNNKNNSSNLKELVAETWSTALLDCGASKTVCGKEWLDQYKETLTPELRSKITTSKSKNVYRFGDGRKVPAIESVIIPATIGKTDINISTDVVNNDIPLLLSRLSMKEANIKLNFENDTITAFGEDSEIPLINTSSGHYAIPISKPTQLSHQFEKGKIPSITLTVSSATKTDREIAIKLHRQFAHPTKDKLLNLINSAGHPWSENEKLKEEIKNISEECKICKQYKRPPPRPIVGLPTATKFQETVALDIKFYDSKMLLHMIDHATRLSSASIIPNKTPETIVKHMLKHWISVYGSADSFMSDNGGEFINQHFLELCELLGITIKTTAAESPWSNGLIERHNLILADMIDKVMAETNCSLEIAVAWCLNAKNSLLSIHGFSPFQLSIGRNPKIPSAFNSKLPALTNQPSFKIIKDNLDALHVAREAFIQAENSSKIKRALSHNVRTSGDVKYISGDTVLYKRLNNHEWHGPAKVLGQDGQQVLIKHGGVYVRVHPCRLQLANPIDSDNAIAPEIRNKQDTHKENALADNESEDEYEPSIQHQTEHNQTEDQNISSQAESQFTSSQSSQDGSQITSSQNASQHQLETNQSLVNIINKLRPNMKIKFKQNGSTPISATIINRAGKSTGKYGHWWNIETHQGQAAIDLSKVTDLQEDIQTTLYINHTDTIVYDILNIKDENEIEAAKLKELDQWNAQNVYTEVEDDGQHTISCRWVIQSKTTDGKSYVKARLCARGFEESQPFRTDSPNCSRVGVRVALTVIASLSWKLNSLDVRTAFLQGKQMDRIVYLKPPKEAHTKQIWKLNKCVYGLSDANRQWYLKLREELINLGAKPCPLDQGIFTWSKDGKLQGIAVCFVDDVLWGGEPEFHNIINGLKTKFQIGTENQSAFRYVGVDLKQQHDSSIIASQNEYINSIDPIPLNSEQRNNPQRPLNNHELKSLRKSLGQLNWISGMTRPEISFYTCELSTHIKNASIADIISTNKVIKFVKSNQGYIKFAKLDLKSLTLKVFTDASWNNLPNGGSQGGQVVFLSDNQYYSSPILWNSSRLKRVARSTLAAESLSLTEGCDSGYYISKLTSSIINPDHNIPITAFTDNQSLYDTTRSTNLILDKRLRVEISAIREMVEKDEVKIMWICKQKQISDVLTKKGASSEVLMNVLREGKITNILQ